MRHQKTKSRPRRPPGPPKKPRRVSLPELEQAILAICLVSPAALELVAKEATIQDFYYTRNQELYASALRVRASGMEVSMEAVLADLGEDLRSVGGRPYIDGMAMKLPSKANLKSVQAYLRDLKRLSVLRRSVELSQRLAADAAGNDKLNQDIIRDAVHDLLVLSGEAAGRGMTNIGAIIEAEMAECERRARRPQAITGLTTGFPDLDHLTSGLQPGNLIVIAGRSGSGKTAIALNVALHLAFVQRVTVGFVSLEMSRGELTIRAIALEGGMDARDVRAGREMGRIRAIGKRIGKSPLHIDDEGVGRVFDRCRGLVYEQNAGVLIIDYLQRLEGGLGVATREQSVASISRSLKQLARELGIPVIALAQVGRSRDPRAGGRPQLADLRESGAIEPDADVVCFLHRPCMVDRSAPKDAAELIVAKHRNGPLGTVELHFDGPSMTFSPCSNRIAERSFDQPDLFPW